MVSDLLISIFELFIVLYVNVLERESLFCFVGFFFFKERKKEKGNKRQSSDSLKGIP